MFQRPQKIATIAFFYRAVGFSAWLFFFTETLKGNIPSAKFATLLAGGLAYAALGLTKFGKPKQETQI